MLTKNFKKLIYRFKQPTYKKRLGKTKFYRIYNFHIRKCGGSSMNYGFTSYPNNNKENYYKLATHPQNKLIINKLPIVGWNLAILKRGSFWYGFSHHQFEKIFPFKKGTFTFTFIRDPLKRVLSLYNMLLDYSKNENYYEKALEEEIKWLGNSFREFIDNLPRQHLQNQLYMFSSKFDEAEAFENLKKINFVGFVGKDEKKFLDFIRESFYIDIEYEHSYKSTTDYQPTKTDISYLKNKLKEEYSFYEKVISNQKSLYR